MSDHFREQLYRDLNQKTTEELTEIWQVNNRAELSDTAFDVIKTILQERLVELPPQKEPIAETNELNNKPSQEVSTEYPIMPLLQLYFSFNGRIALETFWAKGVLTIFASFFIVGLVELSYFAYSAYSGFLVILWGLLIIWPSLAITVKRFHDRDKSGWWLLIGPICSIGLRWAFMEIVFLSGTQEPIWILIGIISIIGLIWVFIEIGFLSGTKGPNQYGAESFY